MESKLHIGRKISRICELRGMRQEELVQALGVSQQAVSQLENSENVEDVRLKDVADALGVSLEGLKNYNDEAVINYISTYNDSSFGPITNHQCTFNPLDKVVELYERLVEAEKEKVAYLERFIGKSY